jgi:hypothetical protein
MVENLSFYENISKETGTLEKVPMDMWNYA